MFSTFSHEIQHASHLPSFCSDITPPHHTSLRFVQTSHLLITPPFALFRHHTSSSHLPSFCSDITPPHHTSLRFVQTSHLLITPPFALFRHHTSSSHLPSLCSDITPPHHTSLRFVQTFSRNGISRCHISLIVFRSEIGSKVQDTRI